MAISPIKQVSGRGVHIPGADIDTDRIIPARFMKCVTFDGLGEYAFYDVRIDPVTGETTDHPLNEERFKGAEILLAGPNFGCGSSREHAPQSLYRYGFRAAVAESFAEIFYGNSTTLGFPCVSVSKGAITQLREAVEADPATKITVDVEHLKVSTNTGLSFDAEMPKSSQEALVSGKYDPLAELLGNADKIEDRAKVLGYAA